MANLDLSGLNNLNFNQFGTGQVTGPQQTLAGPSPQEYFQQQMDANKFSNLKAKAGGFMKISKGMIILGALVAFLVVTGVKVKNGTKALNKNILKSIVLTSQIVILIRMCFILHRILNDVCQQSSLASH